MLILSQPTSSQEPFTHSVCDIERQPLASAPRGQVLAIDIPLLGYVLTRLEDLRGRGRSKSRGQDRAPERHGAAGRGGEQEPRELPWGQPRSPSGCQLLYSRFDLMGLSPDAPEDEAGIKKAAENSKAPAPPRHLPSPPRPPRKVLGRTSCLAPFLESLQQLSPHPVMPPPPSQGLD